MDGEEIRSLLASVAAPAEMPIPVPPNMSAVPAAPVLDAGADPAEVVPDKELQTARAPAVSLGAADLIAFVPTKDMGKARPFY